MTALVVSDLHLAAARPAQVERFLALLDRARTAARAVYILGDLFEVWLGDDDDTPPHPRIVAALAALARAGVEVGVQRGNRDFLLGATFACASGARLLGDHACVDLGGRPALLMHGDLLCTRDVAYQRFRRVVRNPLVRGLFLAAPLAWRRHLAAGTRAGTVASVKGKPAAIMDVEQASVEATMRDHGVDLLVHGHTHRPGIHDFVLDGRPHRRVVLADWYEADGVLVADAGGLRLLAVEDYLAGH